MIVLSLIQSLNADCFLPSFFKLDWSSPIVRTDHIGEGITRQHFVRVRCCCWVALRFYITCHLLREVVVQICIVIFLFSEVALIIHHAPYFPDVVFLFF